jgi:hypothetical protein
MQHGCNGPWCTMPETILPHKQIVCQKKKLFVYRQEEAEILKKAGLEPTMAIGSPAIYLPEYKIKRIPNSLLIMPQHSLVGLALGSELDRKRYIESIIKYFDKFKLIAACISPSCLRNGYFIKELKKYGIHIISGAMTRDANALVRMKYLMQQFEYMTTNGWGSHLAYGLYYSMKVSVFGDQFKGEYDEILKDKSWKAIDSMKRKAVFENEYKQAQNFVEPFIALPHQGIKNIELGQWLLGEINKKSPEELISLFEWHNEKNDENSLLKKLLWRCLWLGDIQDKIRKNKLINLKISFPKVLNT